LSASESAASVPGINLEYKGQLCDITATEDALAALGARHAGTLHQRDTYFQVEHGRLKLREQENDVEMIAYTRAEGGGDRWSCYTRTPVTDAAATRAGLSRRHGVRGVVEKTRRLWLYENARIHLDRVTRLGDFLEIEVVDPSDPATAQALLAQLLIVLDLRQDDGIASSYIDLLQAIA